MRFATGIVFCGQSILMKKVLPLLIVITSLSCTKDHTPSVVGKWNIVESWNDVGQVIHNHSQETFIKFNVNGTFEMDTISSYFAYKQYLNNMDRYQLISDREIKFYSSKFSDSAIVSYSLDDRLILGFHYIAEKFVK